MGSWYVYILRCGDGSLYTGITPDVQARLAAHAEGKGAKYTRGRGPLTLVYTEACPDRAEASRREYAIKQLPRPQKEALIETAQETKNSDLSGKSPSPLGRVARSAGRGQ